MYYRPNHLAYADTPANVQAPDPADRVQRAQVDRDCKGVNVLEWLERGRDSLREYIAYLEQRLAATPRLVEGHHKLRRLQETLNRALRRTEHPPKPELRAHFEAGRRKILTDHPEIERFYFPRDYVVRTVDEELAQVRCKLSRARLNFQTWYRTGRPPEGAGFVRMCSPQPGRPTLWTIGGFAPNAATLTKSQLSEIDFIAGGLARNPRTRAGMPVLTITGRFAPGENSSVGAGRAIAVRNALVAALNKIDPNLLQFISFNLAAEPWCGEVAITLRERIAAGPDLRLRLSPDHPLVQPRNTIAPTGTPLPAGPPPGPRERKVQDMFRSRVDRILRSHGVKDPAVRRAIADSALFQGELGLRSAVGNTNLSADEQRAVVESILNRERQ
jgi:hypothetical protein